MGRFRAIMKSDRTASNRRSGSCLVRVDGDVRLRAKEVQRSGYVEREADEYAIEVSQGL